MRRSRSGLSRRAAAPTRSCSARSNPSSCARERGGVHGGLGREESPPTCWSRHLGRVRLGASADTRSSRALGSGGMSEVTSPRTFSSGAALLSSFFRPPLTRAMTACAGSVERRKAASALNHPNILTVHEVGRWHERDFIATEYVEGVTLRARMREKAVDRRGDRYHAPDCQRPRGRA